MDADALAHVRGDEVVVAGEHLHAASFFVKDANDGLRVQVDFMRGAARSDRGRSIVALPSTAKQGAISRITVELGHNDVP